MANAAYWFKHDSNAKDDYKCMILVDQLGLEGYGIFWILIETLREQTEGRYPLAMLPILAKRYNSSAEKFRAVVTGYGLFETFEDDSFASPALLKRIEEFNELRRINSLKGKRSAERRAEIAMKESTAVQPLFNGGSTAVQPVFNDMSRQDKTGVDMNRQDKTRCVKGVEISKSVLIELQNDGFDLSVIDEVIDGINQSDKVTGKINSVKGLLLSWLKHHKSKQAKSTPQLIPIVKPIAEQIKERNRLYNIPENELITPEQATAMRVAYEAKFG